MSTKENNIGCKMSLARYCLGDLLDRRYLYPMGEATSVTTTTTNIIKGGASSRTFCTTYVSYKDHTFSQR